MMTLFAIFSLTGCETPALDEPDLGPYFCDVEQPRHLTPAVLEYRLENDRDNLALDAKTNATIDAECG